MTLIPGRTARTGAVAAAILSIVVAGGYAPSSAESPHPNFRTAASTSYPSVFVGAYKHRLAVFHSSNGSFARYLTPAVSGTESGLPALSPARTTVFYVRTSPATPCPGTYRIPLAGGSIRSVRSGENGGAQPIASGAGGALAGTYACIASQFVHAKAANGKSYNITGVRRFGANGLSWAPDGYRLAVATTSQGVRYLDVRTTSDFGLGKLVPCPAGMSGCVTHAPSYTASGVLYYVAVMGSSAKVVRLSNGKGVTVFSLPRTSVHYSLAAGPGNHVLVSGDSDSATMTSSNFVVRWDGTARYTLGRSMFQVDW